ncbi:hypothetical protein BWQ93_06035 [Sphingopyxis sp. QXT-31]|nr:hypothetical protein BWQ93_06035 [Sphingopyxis sp. QXT-31]
MFDPTYLAERLSGPKKRRLCELAHAGQSLPFKRTDNALQAFGLIERYTGVTDDAFTELTSKGMEVAQVIVGRGL